MAVRDDHHAPLWGFVTNDVSARCSQRVIKASGISLETHYCMIVINLKSLLSAAALVFGTNAPVFAVSSYELCPNGQVIIMRTSKIIIG